MQRPMLQSGQSLKMSIHDKSPAGIARLSESRSIVLVLEVGERIPTAQSAVEKAVNSIIT
jgi:DNA-binding IclR family transcriptional regulator